MSQPIYSNEPLDPKNMSYDETCYYIYGIDLDDEKYNKDGNKKTHDQGRGY